MHSDLSLEVQMTKLKLSYYAHVMQISSSLEKFITLGKVKSKEVPAAR